MGMWSVIWSVANKGSKSKTWVRVVTGWTLNCFWPIDPKTDLFYKKAYLKLPKTTQNITKGEKNRKREVTRLIYGRELENLDPITLFLPHATELLLALPKLIIALPTWVSLHIIMKLPFSRKHDLVAHLYNGNTNRILFVILST